MIAGRYTLDREVGRGGMGTVWLGRDEVLGRAVALKRMATAPGTGDAGLARAEREARLAARLNHPHVVAIFDLVIEDDQQWLVMEYVEHQTLGAVVARQGRLAPEQAAPLLAQAADALAAAHAAGIVHRDVKPSNILVTPQGRVKLTDFGIARGTADAALTQTGLVTGSPAYLAPEVASGRTATTASDVWSLGATLHHALSGRPPYEVDGNLMGTLYRIVHEDPPRLPDAGWLAPLLAATMTREPADRWPMSRVRDVLRAGGEPAAPVVAGVAIPTRTLHLPQQEPAGRADDDAPEGRPSRRVGLMALLVGAAVVVVGLLAWALATGGGADRTGAQTPEGSASSHSPGASGTPSGGSSGPSDGASTGAAGRPTSTGMQDFITSYLATVTSDPRRAFEMLTPQFQAESGGLDGYEGFWDNIRTARVRSFTATDPGSLTVGYVVGYVRQDGSRTTDSTSLQLVFHDGRYLIAGEG